MICVMSIIFKLSSLNFVDTFATIPVLSVPITVITILSFILIPPILKFKYFNILKLSHKSRYFARKIYIENRDRYFNILIFILKNKRSKILRNNLNITLNFFYTLFLKYFYEVLKKKLLFSQKANKNEDKIFTSNQRVTNIEK